MERVLLQNEQAHGTRIAKRRVVETTYAKLELNGLLKHLVPRTLDDLVGSEVQCSKLFAASKDSLSIIWTSSS